jgi:DNA replication protein DnaC
MEVSDAKPVAKLVQCEKHGEFVSKATEMPVFRGRFFWSSCPTCSTERTEAEESRRIAEEEAARQRRMEQRLSQSGIPLRFRDRTFENYVADTEQKQKALQAAKEFAENFADHSRDGTTVVFSGKPGTGKSHLALAAAMTVMNTGTAMYLNALDLVRMVRDTWRRDSEMTESAVLNELSTVSLLIIDEIGVQYGTDGEQVILFDVLNRRYRDLMPTILLTNLGAKGMKEFLGERSFDRLREGGIWVTFDWDSHRGRKAA